MEISDNKQCDNNFQGDGHRHAVRLGALCRGSSQTQPAFRDAVDHLVVVSRACDGPEIEFCDDLAEGELRPTLQLAVLFIVRELMLNAMHHSRSEKALVGFKTTDASLSRFKTGVSASIPKTFR